MAKILVVDDDEQDRVGLRSILESGGHEVTTADDGDQALYLYLQHRFHVVVTDMIMPGRDGLSLISAMLQLAPTAAIVAVSGRSASHLQASKVFGARAVLSKPVSPAALLGAVETAMSRDEA